MRRWLGGLCLVALAALGAVAWLHWPRAKTFYTDADTIHQSADEARLRDILWKPPVALPAGINTAADDYEPRISADGQTLFFVRGKAGENADIYFCRRLAGSWTAPERLAGVNSDHDDLGPAPSADGTRLYFYSNRSGGRGGYDLWVAQRGPDG